MSADIPQPVSNGDRNHSGDIFIPWLGVRADPLVFRRSAADGYITTPPPVSVNSQDQHVSPPPPPR